MKRAAIYARVSVRDLDNADDRDSIARQVEACRSYADAHGYAVAPRHVFEEPGISGWSDKARPAWRALRRVVAEGEVDTVIVFAISRAARNTKRLLDFIEECEAAGVQFETVEGGITTTGAMGKALITILAAVAELESGMKSSRAKLKHSDKAKHGEWSGGRVPFGYRTGGDSRLHLNEKEAAAVRSAAEDLLNGVSSRAVLRRWSDEGWRTEAGNLWSPAAFRYLMTNPRLAGLRTVGRDMTHAGIVVGRGDWEPIITRTVHEKLVKLFDSRKVRGGRPERSLLTGLLVCAVDGEKLTGRPQSGSRRYICNHGGHVHLTIAADDAEREVLSQSEAHELDRSDGRKETVIDPRLLPDLTEALDVAERELAAARQAAEYFPEMKERVPQLEKACASAEHELHEAQAKAATNVWAKLARETTKGAPTDADVRALLEETIAEVTVKAAGKGKRIPPADRMHIYWR
jgi:DNA invertase Pin-like site-specific DNA recombinase